MKRRVQWSRAALDDFKSQIAYIAVDNPIAAGRVAERIHASAAALGEIATGRQGRVSGTYEKPVSNLPYVIAYAITACEVVSIFRVIHTSRDWPAENWPR